MIEPARRGKHNLDVLVKATANLPFFSQLMEEPAFEENQIHVQLCKRMILVDEVKGGAVVKRSNLYLLRSESRQTLHSPWRGSCDIQA